MAHERKTISDVVERGGELERRVLKAQAAILKTALPAGVQVSFGEGRRASDVCLVLLKGEREAVLPLPTAINYASYISRVYAQIDVRSINFVSFL